MVDDVHESEGAHRVPHLLGKLSAAIRGAGLRDIDDGQVSPVDCRSNISARWCVMAESRDLRSSAVGGGGAW